jgi:hypothetical protein
MLAACVGVGEGFGESGVSELSSPPQAVRLPRANMPPISKLIILKYCFMTISVFDNLIID